MKKALYIAVAALVGTGMLASCSSDYLDVPPVTDISSDRLSDPSTARTLMDGIYEAMNTQYKGYELNQNVGEAQVALNVGEACGADFICLWNNFPGLRAWTYLPDDSGYCTSLPWMYYYNLVNLSNYIIQAVPATADDTMGTDEELLFYKAQALTIRAHAYTRLLGYYGQRWEDSDNGEAYCIVLRTEPSVEDTPLVTMNQVLKLIYDDCEEAVKLYELTGLDRSNMWEVDEKVLYGVWSRAALIKHDWETAAAKAKLAREGTTIMSETEMFSGFITDNSESIWSMNPTEITTYYWSWGSHYAANGFYTNYWGLGTTCMSYDLYRQTDEKDLRRKFYWMPDKINSVPKFMNLGKMTEKDFWNSKVTDPNSYLNMAGTNVYSPKDESGFGMLNCLAYYLYDFYMNVYSGPRDVIANEDNQYNSFTINYTGSMAKKDVLMKQENGKRTYVRPYVTNFGAQNKFWAAQPYGNMCFPWMRASEMVLTEAEAYYMMGKEAEAKKALTELQSKRITGYSCKTSGDKLLEEIQISRRMELWGEGFGFLDLKRWNQPRVRNSWVEGDVKSGNIPPTEFNGLNSDDIARIQSTKYCNGWRLALPKREWQYNTAIDLSLLKKIN